MADGKNLYDTVLVTSAQLGEEDAGQFITLANRVLEGIHRFQAERNQ